MPYLNLHLDYFDHPKTVMLVAALGFGAAELPIRLWAFCGKFKAKDGVIGLLEGKDLEAILRWPGEAGKAVGALERCGFLSKNEKGYFVHDWKDHQGHIWALKMRNKIVAKNRWKNIKKSQSTVDTSGIPESTTQVPHSIPSNPSKPAINDNCIIPPKIENVTAYCLERKSSVDPQHFMDYNTARGWMIGKSKMKDWQATIRTWEKNQNGNSGRTGAKRIVGAATPTAGKFDAIDSGCKN